MKGDAYVKMQEEVLTLCTRRRLGGRRAMRGPGTQAWGSDSGSKQGPSDLRCHLQEAHQAWAHLLSLQHV